MKRLTTLSLLVPSAALAHPGDHSTTAILHFLTEPDHLVMLALGVAVVAYSVYKLRSRP
jgi:hypothetical protein